MAFARIKFTRKITYLAFEKMSGILLKKGLPQTIATDMRIFNGLIVMLLMSLIHLSKKDLHFIKTSCLSWYMNWIIFSISKVLQKISSLMISPLSSVWSITQSWRNSLMIKSYNEFSVIVRSSVLLYRKSLSWWFSSFCLIISCFFGSIFSSKLIDSPFIYCWSWIEKLRFDSVSFWLLLEAATLLFIELA